MEVRTPANSIEWEGYFELRWNLLRAPWQQLKGSERDDLENHHDTFHAMAIDDLGKIYGVGRLQLLNSQQAQIRYMAVSIDAQGKGVGTYILEFLENIAKVKNIKEIKLQARENAIPFYQRNGYHVQEKTFLMYNDIQHYLMTKKI
ncbi:MAG TPA: GNAT family N-acetyltransferase [Bacteroidia bacterium]|nr:GNAT family N-acetyltransferase [Bacteroidia bacterium]